MEVISAPELFEQRSERFSVLPLPLWSLAISNVGNDRSLTSLGVGFDRSPALATKKSYSEAIERWLYDRWVSTGRSPFMGQMSPAPPATSGFSVHPEKEQSRQLAFLEWFERAHLEVWADGLVSVTSAPEPRLGFLFKVCASHYFTELRFFVSGTGPFVGFVLGELKEGGVIFGSAASLSAERAVYKATLEAVRKLAFVSHWREEKDSDQPFQKAVKFWLSDAGRNRALAFVKTALNAPKIPSGRIDFCDDFLQTCRVGDLWASCYYDLNHRLPVTEDLKVPLL